MDTRWNHRLMTVTLSLLVAESLLLYSHNSDAALIGGPDIISVPANATDSGTVNDHQQAFDERQNVLLAAPLAVDGGFIPAGSLVSSHMIFLNTSDASVFASDTQTWSFDGIVVGVMSDVNGTLEAASTGLLGAIGTLYPLGFLNRGLENGDSYLAAGNTITLTDAVTGEPGDWIRVVTQVQQLPEPSALAVLGLCLAGLCCGRHTRKRGG